MCIVHSVYHYETRKKRRRNQQGYLWGNEQLYAENLRNMQDILQYQIADERKLGMLKRSVEVNKATRKAKAS